MNGLDARAALSSSGTDPIGLTWLVTVRWTTLAAAVGAMVAGAHGLDARVPETGAFVMLGVFVASNAWLWWRVRAPRRSDPTVAGLLICADVALLTWILLKSGGVLNPASAFYLVQIVVAALVLGRFWTGIVTLLSAGGYAALFLAQSSELLAAQRMHPEIATHIRGMWLAFALVSLIIGVLVTRLALAVERRDRALDVLRDHNARATRAASLTTAVAGAAHELGTPLATMAVAAHELERALSSGHRALADDARLIRSEIERCRSLLAGMAGRISMPIGEPPSEGQLSVFVREAVAALPAADGARVTIAVDRDGVVLWPAGVLRIALTNILRNALQAAPDQTVDVRATMMAGGQAEIVVADRGPGIDAANLAHVGEPFFTTKAPGDGIGLGVFVTRTTLQELGGALAIASGSGNGTTVRMTLPADVVRGR
jgi:two-component system sensor histidine kinase RegB